MKTTIFVSEFDPDEMNYIMSRLREVITQSPEIILSLRYDEDEFLHVGFSAQDSTLLEGLILMLLPEYRWGI